MEKNKIYNFQLQNNTCKEMDQARTTPDRCSYWG